MTILLFSLMTYSFVQYPSIISPWYLSSSFTSCLQSELLSSGDRIHRGVPSVEPPLPSTLLLPKLLLYSVGFFCMVIYRLHYSLLHTANESVLVPLLKHPRDPPHCNPSIPSSSCFALKTWISIHLLYSGG